MTSIHVLHSLATLDQGDAAAVVMSLYRKINRKEIQFDFVVEDRPSPYDFEEEIKALGGNVYKIPQFNGQNLYLYRKMFKQLFQEHPKWDIMHIHNTTSAMLFLDLAKKYQLVTIAHAYFDSDLQDFRSYIQRMLRSPIKFQADYLLACSKLAGTYVFHEKEEKFMILNNAIETEKFGFSEEIRRRKRAELGIKNEVVLGHLGRMEKKKNHVYLLEVFKAYQKIEPESMLLLVGEGELQKKLKDKVTSEGLAEKVKFLGVRDDVNELLQAMDIFIFPSLFEGLPVTLIEAQSAGLPIIASDTITREVEITNLILFKSIDQDPKTWARAIDDQLILFREDMTLEVTDAGYDVKETVKLLEKIYQTVIENGD